MWQVRDSSVGRGGHPTTVHHHAKSRPGYPKLPLPTPHHAKALTRGQDTPARDACRVPCRAQKPHSPFAIRQPSPSTTCRLGLARLALPPVVHRHTLADNPTRPHRGASAGVRRANTRGMRPSAFTHPTSPTSAACEGRFGVARKVRTTPCGRGRGTQGRTVHVSGRAARGSGAGIRNLLGTAGRCRSRLAVQALCAAFPICAGQYRS